MGLQLLEPVPKISLSFALAAVVYGVLAVGRNPRLVSVQSLLYYTGLVLLFVLPAIWLRVVNSHVPEPYLDEVFHIPQAQKYIEGKWSQWDDKITTPPGLYLVSYVILKAPSWARSVACGLVGGWGSLENLPASLRETNALAVFAIASLVANCRRRIELRGKAKNAQASLYALHTAFNVTLFPAMFFFSGLYYTDLWSIVAVLLAYKVHLNRVFAHADRVSIWSDVITVLIGIAALTMRQTNVFWVVVYFGGLEAVHAVKLLQPATSPEIVVKGLAEHADAVSAAKAYFRLYASGAIHDPSLADATFYDVVWLVVSVVIAMVCNLPRALRRVAPHLILLGAFGVFVAWNGGVVLGDKSNHVATLHLAQMLYIWPLFVFFSAPLLLGYLVPILTCARNKLSGRQWDQPEKVDGSRVCLPCGCPSRPEDPQNKMGTTRPHDWFLTVLRAVWNLCRTGAPFPLWYLSVAVAAVIVHKSTIIHPFTLADNRHYMFYVFRYTILKHPAARNLLVPAYVICHRLCWQLLCGCYHPASDDHTARQFRSRDCSGTSPPGEYARVAHAPGMDPLPPHCCASLTERDVTSTAHVPAKSPAVGKVTPERWGPETLDVETSASQRRAEPLSTAVLWLLTTALSLVTAPLVEPRYFILPWVMWRMLIPAWKTHDCTEDLTLRPYYDSGFKDDAGSGRGTRRDLRPLCAIYWLGQRVDLRLLVETAWFLVINVTTMYMFICRPYIWRDVEGNVLDEGRLQRFMW